MVVTMTRKKVADPVRTSKQTTLQRILTTTVNDLDMDATVAIMNQPKGPVDVSGDKRIFSP